VSVYGKFQEKRNEVVAFSIHTDHTHFRPLIKIVFLKRKLSNSYFSSFLITKASSFQCNPSTYIQLSVTFSDTLTDRVNKFSPILWDEEDGNKKKENTNKFTVKELPKYFKNLETLAQSYSSGGHFFVDDSITWLDLYVYDILHNLLDHYLWLKTNRQEVEKQPRIAAYLKSRPKTPY
jgi:hypothetical protein